MHISFSKELYPKSALLKAAYAFTDRAYVYLDANATHYEVDIESKKNGDIAEKEFMNELLSQTVRLDVYSRTKNIRELLLARSIASTVIETPSEEAIEETDSADIDGILRDWFEDENKAE